MKKLYLVFFLLIPINLFAAEYYAVGKNVLGQKIALHESNEGIVIAVYNRRDADPAESYLVKQECPGNMWEGLQCMPNRRSPLSGATYKRCHLAQVKVKQICNIRTESGLGYFRCVKGCNSKRVPKILADLGMP
jgi:hypothetical protein